MSQNPLIKITLPLKHFKSGKVREVYSLGENFLIISTDRISAFDHVLPNGIPYKGAVLNQLSVFWFEKTKKIIPNHVLISNFENFPANLKQFTQLAQRSVIVKKTEVIPFECVVRGYLSGSAWIEYKKSRTVCGIKLPEDLKESEKLPYPIFTPATKAETGHDINVPFELMKEKLGFETAKILRDKSLAVYKEAANYALKKGIIIADTKFEFGCVNDEIILIDELLTPDSSRFWSLDSYEAGKPQLSFDKQYVRDYLLSIKWNKEPPIPKLSENVVQETSRKYLEAYEKITGYKLKVD